MFISDRSLVSGPLILIIIARPGTSTYSFVVFAGISALFIRNATPAFERGRSGSLECRSSKQLPKQVRILSARSLSRCVSWMASIAILLDLIVRLIRDHLSIKFVLAVGALAPLMFRVAMTIFAFFPFGWLFSRLFVGPGIGRGGVSRLWCCASSGGMPGRSPSRGRGTRARSGFSLTRLFCVGGMRVFSGLFAVCWLRFYISLVSSLGYLHSLHFCVLA